MGVFDIDSIGLDNSIKIARMKQFLCAEYKRRYDYSYSGEEPQIVSDIVDGDTQIYVKDKNFGYYVPGFGLFVRHGSYLDRNLPINISDVCEQLICNGRLDLDTHSAHCLPNQISIDGGWINISNKYSSNQLLSNKQFDIYNIPNVDSVVFVHHSVLLENCRFDCINTTNSVDVRIKINDETLHHSDHVVLNGFDTLYITSKTHYIELSELKQMLMNNHICDIDLGTTKSVMLYYPNKNVLTHPYKPYEVYAVKRGKKSLTPTETKLVRREKCKDTSLGVDLELPGWYIFLKFPDMHF